MKQGICTLAVTFILQALMGWTTTPTRAQQPKTDVARATALIARAEAIQLRSDFNKKARLYETAASLLPVGDSRASYSLRNAGAIAHELGKSGWSMSLLERSAELAAKRGNVTEAADTYVAALFVALESGSRSAARRFIDRALSLTGSPAMPETDRQRILRRIAQPAAQVRASLPPAVAPVLVIR